VLARVRPPLPAELGASAAGDGGGLAALTLPARPEEGTLSLCGDGKAGTFKFDRAYGPQVATGAVYDDSVSGAVRSFTDGFNVCVFAYGQTGSGKTHTMQGSAAEPGVNVLALKVRARTGTAARADMREHAYWLGADAMCCCACTLGALARANVRMATSEAPVRSYFEIVP
jgi:hypothetical protein